MLVLQLSLTNSYSSHYSDSDTIHFSRQHDTGWKRVPILILLFSEGVHPAHNKPYRKSSTSLTAVSYRFKDRV